MMPMETRLRSLCFRSTVSAQDSGADGAVSYAGVPGGWQCDLRGEG